MRTDLPASVPIDLHTHSTRSDGTYTPSELVRYASEKGLGAMALTDHDTVDGIQEALDAADKMREAGEPAPIIVPGIELSAEYNGQDIHFVGLFQDWESPSFRTQLADLADSRVGRNHKMCALLTEHGYPVTVEELEREFPDRIIARPHIAQHLVDHGLIGSVEEAFNKLIGDDCPYYIPRAKITPEEAIELLLTYHGVPVMAHPLQYHFDTAQLEQFVGQLADRGLRGIEVYYPTHKPADTAALMRLADRFGLLYSGGSDFHGARKKNLDLGTGYGHLFVPGNLLEPIARCAKAL